MKKILFFLFILIASNTLDAQYYYFGRNKVQFDKFDWKVIKTNHFDIYYYDEMEEIAEIGGTYAEQAYNEYKVKLNHYINRRIPLIFYNTSSHFQQTNTTPGFIPEGVGGFFEFLKGRVVIPHDGSLKDFKHVIRHELAHVFMTSKIYGILADHRLSTDLMPPLWFVEGFAEFMSTKTDDQAEMVMRDAVFNDYFTGLKNIYRVYGSFIMYKEGQSFLEFIKEKYGEDKVLRLLDNFWINASFEKVIEYTLNKTYSELDEEWTYSLKQKYYPLYKVKSPIKNGSVKLTKDGYNFSPLYYKEDGVEYIYFQANKDGYSSLYKAKLDFNKLEDEELVIRGEKTEEFEAFHLFESSIDISQDGIISFVTKSGATDAIYFYSIKENRIIKKLQRPELITISSPKFYHQSLKVVFSAVDQKGFKDIYLYNLGDDILSRITNDYYDDRDPVFESDSSIIFSSDRTWGVNEKKLNLFRANLNDHSINYITNLAGNCTNPVLDKGKKFLYFTSDLDSVKNLYRIELAKNNGKINQITSYLTNVYDFCLKDSSTIFFSGFEELSFNLYRFDIPDDSISYKNIYSSTFETTKGMWYETKLTGNTENQKIKYEKEYTLDYAQSQISTDPVFGTRGGAVFSLSDLFGDDNYYFLLYNTADVQSEFLKSFNIAIQRVDLSRRSNYGYGIFHFSGRRYDIEDSDEYYYERSFGGFFMLSFPLNKFQRIESTVTLTNSDKQVITGVLERKALLISNSIEWVMDNSIWAETGPVDGIRALFLLGYTSDIKYSNVNYYSIMADYRQYFRLGLRTAIALRTALFYNEGKEARRYFMGGSWDLRGWPRWSIRGEKMWISSLEFRFPLIDQIRIKFPFVELGFFGFRGGIFFDAGSAWDNKYSETLGSVGAGIRMNLFNALVLRYDLGKKIENDFNNFQKGLFYQFFFGWDF